MRNSVRFGAAVAVLAMLGGCGIFKGGDKKTPVLGQRVPILVSENDITSDPSIAGLEVVLPPAATNAEWAQPGGNASKAMGHLELGTNLARAWSASIPGGTKSARLAASPVVADNRLFVMDTEGTVHAFAADTGAAQWRTPTGQSEENKAARFGGGVSFEGGRVFAANGLGDVVALDAATGAEIWRAKPGGPLRGAPTVAYGSVLVLSQDNQLFALAAADGASQWNAPGSIESQGVFGVAAPAVAQGTVVVGFSSGELNAYRYENGRALWSDSLSRTSISTSVSSLSDIDADPVIDQGVVYAVGQGGRMVAMEMTSGRRIWEQSIAGISTPWLAGEWLFVVTDDARLMAIARGTGKIRWISQLRHYRNEEDSKGPISWTGPVLAGNRLVLINTLGQIAFASPNDGSVTQTIDTKEKLSLPPVVANNTLFLLTDDGKILTYR